MESSTRASLPAPAGRRLTAQKLRWMMAVTTVLLILGAGVGVWLTHEEGESHAITVRDAAVRLEAERLRTALLGAGRLLQLNVSKGGDPKAEIDALHAASIAQWQGLRDMVHDVPAQQASLDTLRGQIDLRFQHFLILVGPTAGERALNPTLPDANLQARAQVVSRIEQLLDEIQERARAISESNEADFLSTARMEGAMLVLIAAVAWLSHFLALRMAGIEIRARTSAQQRADESADALRRLNAELEVRVRERTAALNERNASLGRMHAQLSDVSRELLRVAEAERRLLSRELHDDLGQQLQALKMNLQMLERYPSTKTVSLQESVQLLDAAITQVRERAIDLRPPVLDELGLPHALQWHAQQQSRRSGMPIAVEIGAGCDWRAADPAWSSAVFRIVQEALRNALTHAEASQVQVALACDGDELVLCVRDDGIGIRPDPTRADRSLGLLTMRERTELLRGQFDLADVHPHGTQVRCRWPLRDVLTGTGTTPALDAASPA
jgi:signal transduction histidine kinase